MKMQLKVMVNEMDHHRGSLNAPAKLVEYGDFQCPYCAAAYIELEPLVEEFKREICFVFRQFPLTNIHPFAELAARAAEAAGEQGQFWPMHHRLFENFSVLSEETIFSLAESLNLDPPLFAKDVLRPDLLEKIHLDFSGGVRSGVNGTPTLFLNAQRFNRPISYGACKRALLELLNGSLQDSLR